eukprot:CAMPEP_0184648380 /NCGR_PEP_ID=MMETSP0308-20130426/5494_1 /TAXON_ID=38269 /ORGANISM="Gloeochaete witrockiana, Strain SAG 46.84" /LENGTH=65 /DNA_ID=CAMNT_0027080159 /DNA_START=249 /DNA_END=443 /DNA_ORIENTATION=-
MRESLREWVDVPSTYHAAFRRELNAIAERERQNILEEQKRHYKIQWNKYNEMSPYHHFFQQFPLS